MLGRCLTRTPFKYLFATTIRANSAQSALQNPDSGRIRLVEGWHSKRTNTSMTIEVAREEDRPLLLQFMNEQTRLQEPIISSRSAQVGEISTVFHGILDRSVGSGLTLMMFDESEDLIGIRMTSLAEKPEQPIEGEFTLLPDYKDFIDQQPGQARTDQQVSALCEIMYGYGPKFLPVDCQTYFCMELIGIKPKYQLDGLATKFCQKLFKLAVSKGLRYGEVLCTAKASQRVCQKLGMKVKMEVEYNKFLDNGQICFKNTQDGCTSAQLLIGDLKEMGYIN